MELIQSIETKIADWHRQLPHLPKKVQRWLAANIWWLVIIGVALGIIALLSILFLFTLASALLIGLGGFAGALIGGFTSIIIFIVSLSLIAQVILGGMAIQPLHRGEKRGWALLFLAVLIEAATVALSFLLSFDIAGLLSNLVGLAISTYLLFEIRASFIKVTTSK